MSFDPSLQHLEQALRSLSKAARQSFIAWLIDRYGLRLAGLAERLECEWLVRDAMEVIHQRSVGMEPDLGREVGGRRRGRFRREPSNLFLADVARVGRWR